MDCARYRQLICADDLAPDEEQRRQMDKHEAECLSCANYGTQIRQIEKGICSLAVVKAPDDFVSEVLDCLPSWQMLRTVWSRWRVAGVAVALLLFFGFPTYMLVQYPKPFVASLDAGARIEVLGQTVIVPEDVVVNGDITVYHASLQVLGRVRGNVFLVSSGYSIGQQGKVDGRIVLKEHSPWDKVVYGFRNISQEVRAYLGGAWR
ncbi:MAG: Anti-sigma-W factor RsiW [Firmicutes bacterium]|nr:Anti-sigma-W factor RsiW [Bacillota bacterium]MBT9157570.1 Anti-sigma-W factor RsiW [Bacillota bacterium]